MLVLFASGDSATEATGYSPSSSVVVANPTEGAVSDVTLTGSFPSGGSMVKGFDSLLFLPPEWGVATDLDIPNGSIAALADAFTNLGAFNTFCGLVQVPVDGLPLQEATTGIWSDPTATGTGTIISDTVVFEDTDSDGVGEIFDDPDTGDLPVGNSVLFVREGVVKYPEYLSDLFPKPRLRFWGYFDVGGSNIAVNWLIWDPGALIGRGIPADKGYPMMLTLNRSGDPLEPPNPTSPLTDLCSSFTFSITILGTTTVNPLPPNPGAAVEQMQNPDAKGSYDFRDFSRSQRDADNDGFETGVDTCPVSFNSDTSPRTPGTGLPSAVPPGVLIATGPPPVPSTTDPDGWIDLGPLLALPAFVNPPGSNPGPLGADGLGGLPVFPLADISAPEGIDSACDAGPISPCGPTFADDFLAQDCDLDGELNRGDNCPQVFNPSQADTDGAVGSFAPDLGPADDDIGDACDPFPGVPNGHYHISTDPQGGAGPICIGPPVSALYTVDTCGPIDSTGNSPAVLPSIPASLLALLPTPTGASAAGPITFPDDVFSRVTVVIGKHGVASDEPTGASSVNPSSTQTEVYKAKVKNVSDLEADGFRVGLKVIAVNPACPVPDITLIDGAAPAVGAKSTDATSVTAFVDQTAGSVPANSDVIVEFTVEFSPCAVLPLFQDADYRIIGDACHLGDLVTQLVAGPAGLFGDPAGCGTAVEHASVGDNDGGDDVPQDRDVDDENTG